MPFMEDDYDALEVERFRTWHKKIDKKYFNRGTGIWVLHKRTLNTALAVLRKIHGIEFVDLSLSLYIYCKDAPGFEDLIHKYESAIELAGANPDKFIETLHRFYVDQATIIKTNNLYRHFFELLCFCEANGENIQEKVDETKHENLAKVTIAYLDLLLQQMEYIRPDPYNFNTLIYGIRTDGTLIVGKDPLPSLDLPSYYAQHENFLSGRKPSLDSEANVIAWYNKFGYPITDTDSISALAFASQTYTNNVHNLLPFINEYTFDIVPEYPLQAHIQKLDWPVLLRGHKAVEEIKTLLRTHRRRTLPSNGARMEIDGSEVYKSIFLKEIFHNDRIVMLYRLTTVYGEFSGYYDTKSDWLYSCIFDSNAAMLHDAICHIALWFYAAVVCNSPDIVPTSDCFARSFNEPNCHLSAKFFSIGGRVRNTLDKSDNEASDVLRMDRDKYAAEEKSISGYVRRLPVGQKASERAAQIASDLGYELADNETYVQPFVKNIWILREKE